MLDNSVWDRAEDREEGTMSRRLYMLLVCVWTAIGVAFSAALATYSQSWDLHAWSEWTFLGFLLACFVVSLVGTVIATSSDHPVISAFGYSLVAGAFGLLLGPVVAVYQTSSVVKVFGLTSLVVLVLGLVGVFIPDDLASWGTPLLGALLLLIGGQIAVPLLGIFGVQIRGAMTILDWAGLLVFGALVIFDLNRAARLPYTLDNAIDSALAIYLDFINIFLRLLELFGKKN